MCFCGVWLNTSTFLSKIDDEDGEATLRRQEDLEMKDMDGAPDGSADREPMKPSIDSRKPAPLPQQPIDEDAELYEPPVCIPYHCELQ